MSEDLSSIGHPDSVSQWGSLHRIPRETLSSVVEEVLSLGGGRIAAVLELRSVNRAMRDLVDWTLFPRRRAEFDAFLLYGNTARMLTACEAEADSDGDVPPKRSRARLAGAHRNPRHGQAHSISGGESSGALSSAHGHARCTGKPVQSVPPASENSSKFTGWTPLPQRLAELATVLTIDMTKQWTRSRVRSFNAVVFDFPFDLLGNITTVQFVSSAPQGKFSPLSHLHKALSATTSLRYATLGTRALPWANENERWVAYATRPQWTYSMSSEINLALTRLPHLEHLTRFIPWGTEVVSSVEGSINRTTDPGNQSLPLKSLTMDFCHGLQSPSTLRAVVNDQMHRLRHQPDFTLTIRIAEAEEQQQLSVDEEFLRSVEGQSDVLQWFPKRTTPDHVREQVKSRLILELPRSWLSKASKSNMTS